MVFTRKSTMTDFILVCPDLKSSPPIMTLCLRVRVRVGVGVRVGVKVRVGVRVSGHDVVPEG